MVTRWPQRLDAEEALIGLLLEDGGLGQRRQVQGQQGVPCVRVDGVRKLLLVRGVCGRLKLGQPVDAAQALRVSEQRLAPVEELLVLGVGDARAVPAEHRIPLHHVSTVEYVEEAAVDAEAFGLWAQVSIHQHG